MTIAGSDSGGGAGIQSDLRVFSALGVHGTTVITSLTAQNPKEVREIHAAPPRFVRAQLETVFAELPPKAAKTGMLYSTAIIREVASFWRQRRTPLVVDPVMIATSGASLLEPSAQKLLLDQIFPRAALITPNLPEAEAISGRKIRSLDEATEIAEQLEARFGCAVLLKGGHLKSTTASDILRIGGDTRVLSAPFVRGVKTHGTGCAYSAAIAARLAQGAALPDAVEHAKDFISTAIQQSYRIGRYTSLNLEAPSTGGKTQADDPGDRNRSTEQ